MNKPDPNPKNLPSKHENDKKNNDIFKSFVFDQPAKGESVEISIPKSPNFRDLARVRLVIDNITNRVFLTSTIGWGATAGTPNVLFSIYRRRQAFGTEEQIFYTVDQANGTDSANTSFTLVDDIPVLTQEQQLIEYVVRVRIISPGNNDAADVVGPIILTAAEIGANPTN
ncbi:hypothetical protein [Bacillus cereus]|nr:hypothetical protein [Bacillus cereus]MCU5343238.1 hypothetical protein [Bacillus cereus]